MACQNWREEGGGRWRKREAAVWARFSRLSLTLVLLFFVSVLFVSWSKGASVTLSWATSESAPPSHPLAVGWHCSANVPRPSSCITAHLACWDQACASKWKLFKNNNWRAEVDCPGAPCLYLVTIIILLLFLYIQTAVMFRILPAVLKLGQKTSLLILNPNFIFCWLTPANLDVKVACFKETCHCIFILKTYQTASHNSDSQ